MGFSTNYENVDEYGLVPVGMYEVVIRNIEEHTTKKGSTGLNLSLVIRNDVEQKQKNRYLFHTLWKRKEPTQADMQVQGYSFNQLMQLAKAAKLPSGKAYETVEDLCKDLLHRPLLVKVKHDKWSGNLREEIERIEESKFPQCNHVFKVSPAIDPEAPAQKPEPGFASQNTAAPAAQIGNLGDFEEILGDGEIPF